jgi:hypothetical protein
MTSVRLKWSAPQLRSVRRAQACPRCLRCALGEMGREEYALGNVGDCIHCLRIVLAAGYRSATKLATP